VLAAVVAAASCARAQARPLPVYWTLPAFALVDEDGRNITAAALAGHPWLADFIFTRCAGACPLMTARLVRLQKRLPAGARIASITVDPEYDSPATLKQYARDVGAQPGWIFLTGRRDELYRLAVDGFKLEAMAVPSGRPQGDDGPFLHSAKIVLVDGQNRVRGYYDSDDDASLARLLPDWAQVEG
jgi:protein SCO1/2